MPPYMSQKVNEMRSSFHNRHVLDSTEKHLFRVLRTQLTTIHAVWAN